MKTLPQVPKNNQLYLSFINAYPCDVTIGPVGSISGIDHPFDIQKSKSHKITLQSQAGQPYNWTVSGQCVKNNSTTVTIGNAKVGKAWYTLLSPEGYGTYESALEKSITGEGQFKLSIQWFVKHTPWCDPDKQHETKTYLLCSPKDKDPRYPCVPFETEYIAGIDIECFGSSSNPRFVELKPDHWRLYYLNQTQSSVDWKSRKTKKQELAKYLVYTNVSFTVNGQGGIYTRSITGDYEQYNIVQTTYTIASENSVPILWQIPQYVVITASEILISITGLEFSYSQAPQSMKSVIQAVWLLTVAGGDFIDLAIAEARIFTNLAWEFLLYAVLMAVVILIFAAMAQFWYTYTYYTLDEADEETTGKNA